MATARGKGKDAKPKPLADFDGKEVLSATVSVTNAGDGLSSAMKVEPAEFHHGEIVYVVLACEVAKVRFDPIKDTDALQRVHILRAGEATIVDESVVSTHLEAQRVKIEEAAGIQRLFKNEGAPDPTAPGGPLGPDA